MKKYILLLVLQLIANSIVYSCSCAGQENVRYSFKNSEYSFKGELVDIGLIGTPDSIIDTISARNISLTISYKNCYKVYKFIPIEFYKGSIDKDTISIYGPTRSSCGLPVELNKTYLVFTNLWKEKDVLYSNYCSGTEEANKKSEMMLKHLTDQQYVNYLDSIEAPLNKYLTEQLNDQFNKYNPAPFCDNKYTLKISKGNRILKIYAEEYYYYSLKGHLDYLSCKRKIKRAFRKIEFDWVQSKYEYYKQVVDYEDNMNVFN